MRRLDTLPDLPPAAPFLLAGLLATWWLWMRIRILRRRLARNGGEVAAWAWLRALAATSWIGPVLAVVAVGLVAGLVLTWP